MEIISGGVTAAQGFLAAGIASGIKKSGRDMAMLYFMKKGSLRHAL